MLIALKEKIIGKAVMIKNIKQIAARFI